MPFCMLRALSHSHSFPQPSSSSAASAFRFLPSRIQCRQTASAVNFKVKKRSVVKRLEEETPQISAEQLRPSEGFIKSLSNEKFQHFNKIFTELELFVLISKFIPQNLSDEDWNNTFTRASPGDRVRYWEHLAIKSAQIQRRIEVTSEKGEKMAEYCVQQKAIYDSGGMGYSSDCYTLLLDPFSDRRRKNLVDSGRFWRSTRIDKPRIVLDLEQFSAEDYRDKHVLYLQLFHLIRANLHSSNPLPISVANVKDANERSTLQIRLNEFISEPSSYLLPDITAQPLNDFFSNKQDAVYISKHAKEDLEGPLDRFSTIFLCLSLDHKKQSLAAARRSGVRTMRLPITKHVYWKSGIMYLPIEKTMETFRDVLWNEGDWKTALLNNISKRHLLSFEERSNAKLQESKMRIQNQKEVIAAVTRLSEEWEKQQKMKRAN
ncbi:hypothetical protein WR25_11456 [Diploscapter pachys]|uniref:SAM-dependent MTase TRM10-type domain-containing protein n=1 Tax=Diploscapter pachys TaxID=2018661 RepID=A0A2A2J6F7_9BILA|nr:hypothetical protein WR25_11456 [Diploscapter pachys]